MTNKLGHRERLLRAINRQDMIGDVPLENIEVMFQAVRDYKL